jgi:hypothetical protein
MPSRCISSSATPTPASTLRTYVHLLPEDLPEIPFAAEVGNGRATRAAETGRDAATAKAVELAAYAVETSDAPRGAEVAVGTRNDGSRVRVRVSALSSSGRKWLQFDHWSADTKRLGTPAAWVGRFWVLEGEARAPAADEATRPPSHIQRQATATRPVPPARATGPFGQ